MGDHEDLGNDFNATAVDYDPFVKPPAIEVIPTSAQSHLWLLSRAGGGADRAYKESLTVELFGDVNDSALIRAIQSLTGIHDALRGHFRKDGQRFIIEPRIDVPVAHFDLSNRTHSKWLSEVRRLVELDCASPFNLESGPLFRTTVVRIAPRHRVVVLTAHQVVCDGWSMDVALADLGRLYSAFVGSKPLPTLPLHGFCEYLQYRRTAEVEARARASKIFWQELFSAPPSPLKAQQNHRLSEGRVCPSNSAPLTVRPEVFKVVKEFASGHGLSVFSVLLSAFSVLIYRIFESHDFTLAIPVAGHPEAGMEDCVGPLVSVVPVRCRFEPQQSFDLRCKESYRSVLDARDQSSTDLRDFALEALASSGIPGVPLPSVAFSHVQKYAPGKLAFGDCKVDYQLNAPAFEDFAISLVAFEAQDSITLDLRASSDLYSQDWLIQRLEEYENILALACESPRGTVEAISSSAYAATSFAGDYPRGASCKYFRRPAGETPSEEPGGRTEEGGAPAETSTRTRSDLAPDQSPIIVTLQPGQSGKVPLLLLLGVELYIDIAMAMTDGRPVVAIHIPMLYELARTGRPPLSQVVARYVQAVRRVRPTGPYSLGGLCFGGIVAYEVARSLRQQGEDVTLVALFDAVLPRGRHVDRRKRLGHLVGKVIEDPKSVMLGALKGAAAANASRLLKLPVATGLVHRVVTWGTGEDPNKTVDLPVLGYEAKADVAKLEMSRPYLDAPLLVFRATRVEEPAGQTTDPDCGWVGLARSVQPYEIESEHLNIVRWPHAATVARVITGGLGEQLAVGSEILTPPRIAVIQIPWCTGSLGGFSS